MYSAIHLRVRPSHIRHSNPNQPQNLSTDSQLHDSHPIALISRALIFSTTTPTLVPGTDPLNRQYHGVNLPVVTQDGIGRTHQNTPAVGPVAALNGDRLPPHPLVTEYAAMVNSESNLTPWGEEQVPAEGDGQREATKPGADTAQKPAPVLKPSKNAAPKAPLKAPPKAPNGKA